LQMRILAAISAVSIAACATTQATPPVQSWQEAATPDDRMRLREWRTAFTQALAQANAGGHAADVAQEGVLLEPDAALGGPIPDGDYRCRVVKVGAKSEGMLDYVSYPAFRCRIEHGKAQRFTKLTGSQRHVGLIYPADQLRSVFLGTLVLGDESQAYKYGSAPERDLAGWVERIGDNRWRIVLPYPHFESTLDVIELVPEQ
ncbi:MAG TPA: DUF4893 domain-containing protein, partial [Sphingomicrobium sp.]|nr:DUF4893 domain-containing protein [Sphingomicrobium sp.]